MGFWFLIKNCHFKSFQIRGKLIKYFIWIRYYMYFRLRWLYRIWKIQDTWTRKSSKLINGNRAYWTRESGLIRKRTGKTPSWKKRWKNKNKILKCCRRGSRFFSSTDSATWQLQFRLLSSFPLLEPVGQRLLTKRKRVPVHRHRIRR